MVQQSYRVVFTSLLALLLATSTTFAETKTKNSNKKTNAVKTNTVEAPENLFEGYYKILLGEKHIGYMITRFDYDTKQKQFIARTYQKIKTGSEEETQGLVAFSDDGFNPLKYEFTSSLKETAQVKTGGVAKEVVKTKTRTIDAQFAKGKMTALFQEDGVKKNIKKDIPKGVFLSTFLTYLILKQPKGLSANLNINYSAIAEEDADIYSGKVTTGVAQKKNNLSVLEAKTEYKQNKFSAYVTDRGEVLGTNSTLNGVKSELVAQPSEATQNFELNTKALETIFGEVPLGTNNLIAKAARANTMLPQDGGKTQGVPAGQGIQLKTSPPSSTAPADKKD